MELIYIKLFLDDVYALEELSDAETGRLLRGLLTYAATGVTPQLSGNERILFPMLRQRIERDKAQMEDEAQKKAEAGRKGALARASTAKQSLAELSTAKQSLAKQAKTIDKRQKTIDKRQKTKDYISCAFDAFWKAYPRKVSKAAALSAWEKLNPDEDLIADIMSSVENQKKSAQWQRDNGQFIPHAATWLNQRRWEDEPDMQIKADTGRAESTHDLDELEAEYWAETLAEMEDA